MGCPKFFMIIVFVPSQADYVISPLNTLNINVGTWPPCDLEGGLLPWEFFAQEYLSLDVSNDRSRTESRWSIPNIRKPWFFFESFFEATKSFAPSKSSASSKKEYHRLLLALLGKRV